VGQNPVTSERNFLVQMRARRSFFRDILRASGRRRGSGWPISPPTPPATPRARAERHAPHVTIPPAPTLSMPRGTRIDRPGHQRETRQLAQSRCASDAGITCLGLRPRVLASAENRSFGVTQGPTAG